MNKPNRSAQAIETTAIHAGRTIDPATGAVVQPLFTSTTFERDAGGEFSRGYSYIRDNNPNRAALEACLAALEGGEAAVAVSSGMAAAYAVLQALSPGDHVVLHRDMYYGVRELVMGPFARWGLTHTAVDMRVPDEVRRACGPKTRLLWLETPTNPLIEVVPISPVAEVAREVGALLACENTFATPVLQRPLDLGADLVVHSLTKYLSGHSDSMGGAVVLKREDGFGQRVREFQQTGGAVLAPFDCWLTLRGIETLPVRMRTHCDNARRVAEFLSGHPKVAAVHYPGLTTDPGHAAAVKQMRDFGGMLSFEVRGGRAEAFAMAARLKVITRATSLGGTHSLIEHRASIEGAHTRAPESLLRLSVGLEAADDLIADLEQALHAIG
jgi:cystathionine gamma-synthase